MHPALTSLSRLATAAVFPWLLFALPAAAAEQYCIENVSQFVPKMDAALASADTDVEVRIRSGQYEFATGDFGYFGVLEGTQKTLRISGGWSGLPGQCTARAENPQATLLWGMFERKVFGINASTTFTGTVVVENLQMAAGSGTSGGICLHLAEQNGAQMAIRIDRVRVEACSGSGSNTGPAMSLGSSVGVILRNSVIAGNSSADSGSGVRIGAFSGAQAFVLNNTIAYNSTGDDGGIAGLEVIASPPGQATVANNVITGNSASAAQLFDLRVFGNVTLLNNRYVRRTGLPLAENGSSIGETALEGDVRLPDGSPAIDGGAFFAPILQGTLDLHGSARVQDGVVDQGAVEYVTLLKDGFES